MNIWVIINEINALESIKLKDPYKQMLTFGEYQTKTLSSL